MPEISIKGLPAIILAFAGAVIITWYFIPRIIKVVNKHQLTDKPGKHKIHNQEIPTLGGIAIFAGFTIGLLLAINGYNSYISYIMVAVMLLFFIGVTDDLLHINPRKKLLGEIGIAIIVALFTDLRFTNLHGFLGISAIPAIPSYLISIFIIVLIINAFNLIDGIDGLAASTGIIASLAFGSWFILSKDYGYTIMAVALLGSLLVFIRFNFTSGQNKIFMGDTGSLVIGFILAVFAIHFNEMNAAGTSVHRLDSSPSVSIAILIVPLFDTLRVIALRTLDHQSPFVADNRHIHHMMLRAGFTHLRATLYISLFNILIIAVAFLLDSLGILVLGVILLGFCIGATEVVRRIVKKRERLSDV
jgi:UDP-GlcNAc:undecaprenyl-phosphate/decaprenyl-phosphate GlcNAc-1-phosphate transferase